MMIAQKTVQQGHYFTAGCRINNFVNSSEREVILGTTFVKVGKICAHSPFSILFANHHDIG
jgi:hypothetical protein